MSLDSKKTTKIDKIAWIKKWATEGGAAREYFDIMNAAFVADYSEQFGVKCISQPYGPDTCKELGRTLSWGYKNGYLDRGVIGISGAMLGIPKWVYVYSIRR